MAKTFLIPTLSDLPFSMESNFWSGKVTLTHNKKVLEQKSKYAKVYLFRDKQGNETPIKIKMGFPPGYVAVVNGQKFEIDKPLPWYDWILCFLPLSILAMGGAIGGGLGALGFLVNTVIARMESIPLVLKMMLMVLVTMAGFAIWFSIASYLRGDL